MRSDSIYKADLADLCHFQFTQTREQYPYFILILRIGAGKTVKDNAEFGKVMRHNDVRLCAIGSLGLWLLARFDATNEMEGIDFSVNSNWFNIKYLVSTMQNDKCVKMHDRAHKKAIAEACKSLGIENNHLLHLGRNTAGTKMDIEEVSGYDKMV